MRSKYAVPPSSTVRVPRWTRPLAVAVLVAACAAPAPAAAPGSRSAAPAPSTGVRWPATGALFGGPPQQLGDHYCTAAVVDSPAGDVLITAAHCVADGDGTPARTGMSFAPGYHDHAAPYGIWTVTASAVDDTWRGRADPDHDIAFLTVQRADGRPVQQVVGGYRLVLDPGSATAVDAIGYPDFADDPNERSGVTTRFSGTQLELDARGLYDGTSGGPWLLAAPNTDGETDVIAVTGGYEQGGRNPDISYATYLGPAAAALFQQVSGAP